MIRMTSPLVPEFQAKKNDSIACGMIGALNSAFEDI